MWHNIDWWSPFKTADNRQIPRKCRCCFTIFSILLGYRMSGPDNFDRRIKSYVPHLVMDEHRMKLFSDPQRSESGRDFLLNVITGDENRNMDTILKGSNSFLNERVHRFILVVYSGNISVPPHIWGKGCRHNKFSRFQVPVNYMNEFLWGFQTGYMSNLWRFHDRHLQTEDDDAASRWNVTDYQYNPVGNPGEIHSGWSLLLKSSLSVATEVGWYEFDCELIGFSVDVSRWQFVLIRGWLELP